MLAKLKPYAKAIIAVIVAGVVALQAALTEGEGGTVTDDEWKAIIAAVVTAVLVYLIPNKPAVEPPA